MKATLLLIVGFLGISSWIPYQTTIPSKESAPKVNYGYLVNPDRQAVIAKKYSIYADSKIIFRGITDVKGAFTIPSETGEYRYIFELYGERFKGLDVSLPEEKSKLDTIVLSWKEVIDPVPTVAEKPMIYLYPTKDTEISVQVENPMTFSYPDYNGEWLVQAQPNGNLKHSNREYYGLFWEGPINPPSEITEGAVVPGNATGDFLENALRQLGYTDWEANEFIIYWLPKMQTNAYNFIYFSVAEYREQVPLIVRPKPDAMVRSLMYFKPLLHPKSIARQDLSLLRVKRTGFTVVEWGGSQLPSQTQIDWDK